MKKEERVSIEIELEQVLIDELSKEVEEQGIEVNEVIRNYINDYLKNSEYEICKE